MSIQIENGLGPAMHTPKKTGAEALNLALQSTASTLDRLRSSSKNIDFARNFALKD